VQTRGGQQCNQQFGLSKALTASNEVATPELIELRLEMDCDRSELMYSWLGSINQLSYYYQYGRGSARGDLALCEQSQSKAYL